MSVETIRKRHNNPLPQITPVKSGYVEIVGEVLNSETHSQEAMPTEGLGEISKSDVTSDVMRPAELSLESAEPVRHVSPDNTPHVVVYKM